MVQEGYADWEDPDDWQSQWVRFGRQLPGVGEPPGKREEDLLELWIDEVVGSFCRRHEMLGKFAEWWDQGGQP